ncbi:IS30 family transposase [uncultured Photobacterium sp.]|uniref:IS30 family transposase n=1 Tax=uncultured Photobacterium sp. TaxID=173973 RepID=UPI002610B331|nr:IS30 family transposase [uncultured Photobacterium sp.]
MRQYKQLTDEQRYTIAQLRLRRKPVSFIADVIGVHRSTVYREVKRNKCNDNHYRVHKAGFRTRGRRSKSRKNSQFSRFQMQIIEAFIKADWSPEQISGYLRTRGMLNISHETIYRYIWLDKKQGGTLYKHLRCAPKQRRKRYRSYDNRGRLADKRHISERPKEVESRDELGHWEIDTVIGKDKKHCILTLVERKTGYTLIGKLTARTKNQVTSKTIEFIKKHRSKFKTITADNGTEFHGYKEVEKATSVLFYFATPHHSWERGTNENTNGLIRQYLPKGSSMAHVTQKHCYAIAHKLNTRPRKRLGFYTPGYCYAQ